MFGLSQRPSSIDDKSTAIYVLLLIDLSSFSFPLSLLTDIQDIPEDIKHLRSLQVADFSSNPIPRLPAGFAQLKSLTVLGLNDMSLTSLPSDFGQ